MASEKQNYKAKLRFEGSKIYKNNNFQNFRVRFVKYTNWLFIQSVNKNFYNVLSYIIKMFCVNIIYFV